MILHIPDSRWRNVIALGFFAAMFLILSLSAKAAGKAEHVVIVVMDGLRPDVVNEENMPTLTAMGREGTFFATHHPAYPSTTEVNGAGLATGAWPVHNGIVANREYRPDVELLGPVDTQGDWASWKGDQVRGGQWVTTSTLVEMVRARGLTAVAAGTKPVIMLWDRSRQGRTVAQPLVYDGRSVPGAALDGIVAKEGPMPPTANSKLRANTRQDEWTTRALLEEVWKESVPALSVLWLSEPDYSQHGSGPGSAVARAAYKSSDDCLARVRAALAERHLAEKTDILVVSDHGFSTISRNVDIMEELKQAGFDADREFTQAPKDGKLLVIGLGGTVSFHVIGHDARMLEKLLDFLQQSDWAGVIFTRDGLPGTFKLSTVGIDAPGAPDVVVAMRWKDEPWADRLPGTVVVDDSGGKSRGLGMHGSLSRFDMHNTLIACGPDFKTGFVSDMPSGNSDVTPTVLNILGVPSAKALDGRVLREAMVGGGAAEVKPQTRILEARREMDDKTWRQYLKLTEVGDARYYDEGNAGVPK
jgi:arylsulfatase A-like enzyme